MPSPVRIVARWADRHGDREYTLQSPDSDLIPSAGELLLLVDEDGYQTKLEVVERHFAYGGGGTIDLEVVLWCRLRD